MVESLVEAILAKHGVRIDIAVVDYIGIMKGAGAAEDSIDYNSLGLRNVARRHNLAMITAQQINRDGQKALEQGQIITEVYVEGSKVLINNSDKIIIYQQTELERKEELARLWAAKGRQKKAKFMVVISQNYTASRFAVSAGTTSATWEATMKGS
ncbi:hypothetical protein CCP3SC1AL1_3490001 [Gammaproteobacteria bacterium]